MREAWSGARGGGARPRGNGERDRERRARRRADRRSIRIRIRQSTDERETTALAVFMRFLHMRRVVYGRHSQSLIYQRKCSMGPRDSIKRHHRVYNSEQDATATGNQKYVWLSQRAVSAVVSRDSATRLPKCTHPLSNIEISRRRRGSAPGSGRRRWRWSRGSCDVL